MFPQGEPTIQYQSIKDPQICFPGLSGIGMSDKQIYAILIQNEKLTLLRT